MNTTDTFTVLAPVCMVCSQRAEIQLTEEEFRAYSGPGAIQDRLPNRDADFREMLISGTHPECWTALFGSPED